jgi:hypothetical protein
MSFIKKVKEKVYFFLLLLMFSRIIRKISFTILQKESIISQRCSNKQMEIITEKFNFNYLIKAGAGSGKTKTILERVLYMVNNGIPIQSIVITTFSVQAARDIKSRLSQLLGYNPEITIGTIDSFARKLLYSRYGQDIQKYHISEYTKQFHKLLLNEPQIAYQFKHIFVDEFQDLNEIQYELLREFNKLGIFITAVGDQQQNIYKFRNSLDIYMNKFKLEFIPCKEYHLNTNYRSTKELVEFSNQVRPFDSFQMDSFELFGSKPMVCRFKTEKLQNESIVDYIEKLIEFGVSREKIAILCPVNYPLYQMEKVLTQRRIPLVLLERVNSYQTDRLHNHVCLSTIHKAKGLEWDIVFMIGMEDKNFALEIESQRLFYVGITRAKKSLSICYNKCLTRFITDIDKKYYDCTEPLVTRHETPRIHVQTVDKILQSLDYEYLRTNIFPDIEAIKTITLYPRQNLCDLVHNHSLYLDFEYFIKEFITRSLSRWLQLPLKTDQFDKLEKKKVSKLKNIQNALLEYKDLTKNTTDIIDSIWNLSLLYSLYKDRPRLFYKDISGKMLFQSNRATFVGIVEKFIKMIVNQDPKHIKFNYMMKHSKQALIQSQCHFVVEKTAYYTSISNHAGIDVEILVKLLLLVALDGNIEYVRVFKPLLGIVYEYDLRLWDRGPKLIEYFTKNVNKIH